MCGAEPAGFLVLPRLVGGLIGMLPIAAIGTGAAFVAGALAGRWGFAIAWSSYFRVSLVEWGDLVIGVCKALAYGVAVPLVSCFAGLSARGGAPGVGRATTYAVIGSSIAVLFLDLTVGAIGYLVFW